MKKGRVKSLLKLQKGDTIGVVRDQEENVADMERAWDDVSGKELDSKGVREARAKGMTYIHNKQVWETKDDETTGSGKRM